MNKRSHEWLWRIGAGVCGFACLAFLAGLFGYQLWRGGSEWIALRNAPDALALKGLHRSVSRTLSDALAGMALCLPLGVGGALWLAELTPLVRRFRWIPACVRALARVPAVLYGLLAALLLPSIGGAGACSLTTGLVMLPGAAAATLRALERVPTSQRLAAAALGAGRWATLRDVVLPLCGAQVVGGLLPAAARAAGAGAALLLAWSAAASAPLHEGAPLSAELFYSAALHGQADYAWACAFALTAFTAFLHLACAVIHQIGASRRKEEWEI